MKPKSLESFGLLPLLFYIALGFAMYKLLMYAAGASNLQDAIDVMTASWLFLIPSGIVLGLTLVATFLRFTPQIRKTLGFLLGALVPLVWPHTGEVVLLASFGVGALIGLLTSTRERTQLRLIKSLTPVPFILLMIPPISEVVFSLQNGEYTGKIEVFLGYIVLTVLLFIDALLLRMVSNHAFRDEDTSEEITLFLGPRQSGKTILSLGFFYELVTGRKGTHEESFVISEEGAPIELSELYGIFRKQGFSGVAGTARGWLTINTFRIKRTPLEKFLFGLKDIKLEITDYAGEILWDLETLFRDPKKYDDFVTQIEKDIDSDFEAFMNAVKYPSGASPETKQRIAKDLQKKIINDVRMKTFDFRKYYRKIYWEKVPEAIRTNLAVAHTVSSLLKADKIVPLIDGEGLLYELYNRDPAFKSNLHGLENENKALYNLIMGSIKKFERLNEGLDSSVGARRATLEAQLRAYDVILSRFKKVNRRGDFAFLVTKADLIAAVFMPVLIAIDIRSIRKRVLEILTRTAAFINLAQKLIPDRQLEEKLMFSIILSPADLKKIDPESLEELRDEILVRGLDDLIEWVRKTPAIRKLQEVLLP